MKSKYYTGLALIIFECLVSGAYTPIESTWVLLRAGLVFVYIVSAYVDRKESINVISYLPLAMIILSLLSVDNKWKSLESEKLKTVKKEHVTKIKAPVGPVLPNCENLTKWRLDECQKKTEKLQLTYNAALEKYNSIVINSESSIRAAKVELTFTDQLPIFGYILFICVLSFINFKATPNPEIKELKKELPKQKIDTEKLVENFIGLRGKTIETYCFENGLAVSSFKRWKKNYETRLKKSETKVRLLHGGKAWQKL
jgi:hypothetical protein